MNLVYSLTVMTAAFGIPDHHRTWARAILGLIGQHAANGTVERIAKVGLTVCLRWASADRMFQTDLRAWIKEKNGLTMTTRTANDRPPAIQPGMMSLLTQRLRERSEQSGLDLGSIGTLGATEKTPFH